VSIVDRYRDCPYGCVMVSRRTLQACAALAAMAASTVFVCSDALAMSNDWVSLSGGGGSGRPLVAASTNGKLYSLYTNTGIFKSFDPVANRWASLASHGGSGAAIAGGKDVYLFGGIGSTTPASGAVAAYDPLTNTWASRASMPVPVVSGAAALGPDGRYYVIGGRDNDTGRICDLNGGCFYGGVQIYDPVTDTWSLGVSGPSSVSVYQTDAVSPGDGWIYVPTAGEAYRPASDTWKLTGTPPHNDFSFAPTADGQIAGFWATVIGTTRDDVVNVYSPSSDRWTDGTPRSAGVASGSAALAPNGSIILIGPGYSSPAITKAFQDVTAPTGSFTINAGATSTVSATVSIDSSPNDTSGAATIRIANSGTLNGDGLLSAGQNVPYAGHVSWQLAGSPAAKTVWVQWLDPFGYWSRPVSHSIKLLASYSFTKPPTPILPTTGVVTDAATPVKISWAASDSVAIVGYQLTQSTDGGSYTGIFNGNATSTKPRLAYGHTYVEHATATDVNNATISSTGPGFGLQIAQETAAQAGGPWQSESESGYSGGSDISCTTSTCAATYSFTGRAIGWVSTIGPTQGAASVSVDGGAPTTVNTNAAATTTRRLVYSHNWTTSALRTVTISCQATSGHPRIDLDALIILS
jgi:hypothetical protein